MKKYLLQHIAGLMSGALVLSVALWSHRPDGDPDFRVIILLAPAAFLGLVQLIVWWSMAFKPRIRQKK